MALLAVNRYDVKVRYHMQSFFVLSSYEHSLKKTI